VTRPMPTRAPDVRDVRRVLHQLDVDRRESSYWKSRWEKDNGDEHIEAWLRSLLEWVGDPNAYDLQEPQSCEWCATHYDYPPKATCVHIRNGEAKPFKPEVAR